MILKFKSKKNCARQDKFIEILILFYSRAFKEKRAKFFIKSSAKEKRFLYSYNFRQTSLYREKVCLVSQSDARVWLQVSTTRYKDKDKYIYLLGVV